MGRIDQTRRVSRLLDLAWHIAVTPRHWTRKLQTLIALPDVPPSPREQTVRMLQLALGQRRRVHLTYETASRGGEVTERDFDP